jgi:hypothetical protein
LFILVSQHIHCLVNDCHYWHQGNKCGANEIMVATDEFGSSQPDTIDATMATQFAPMAAGSCMSTCCKSYVTKGSNQINADGIKRMT